MVKLVGYGWFIMFIMFIQWLVRCWSVKLVKWFMFRIDQVVDL